MMNLLRIILASAILLLSVQEAHAQAIRDSATIQSGEASLFLEIRGADSTKPVVLFLHGGPADPFNVLTFMAYPGAELEQSFLMVYLYQRGIGKSGSAPVESQTMAQHIQDVDRVVDYLRRRFRTSTVSLIGHSWGGSLSTAYVLEHGDKIARLVAVAGPLSNPRGDRESYRIAMEAARARQNAEAIQALEQIGPPPWTSLDQLMVERRWAGRLSSGPTVQIDRGRVLQAGGYERPDSRWDEVQMGIIAQMAPEVSRLDLEPRLSGGRTPLLLIACGRDPIVPPASLRPGFDNYGGPKQWALFEDSRHNPFMDARERFIAVVTAFLQDRAS